MTQQKFNQLEDAYNHCMKITRRHYENFPVASVLLPRHLRLPISVIYAFARIADDFADEGDLDEIARLAHLDQYDENLERINGGEEITDPIFLALRDVIAKHNLSVNLFHDLLTAFRMDITKNRYGNFSEVKTYCKYSANPIGRLVLKISGAATTKNIEYSDSICTALQLINFLQDIERDYVKNGRIYLPLDEMQRYNVSEIHIKKRCCDEAMRQLIGYQVDRIGRLLALGLPLGEQLRGRLGLEIRLTILGGVRVLNALSAEKDIFRRHRLGVRDWTWISWRAFADFKNVQTI